MVTLSANEPALAPSGPVGPPARRAPPPWLLVLPLGLALALLPPALTGVVVGGAAGAAVVLARPRWALYALAVTVPYQSLADIKIDQVNVSVTEIAVLLLLLAWVTQLAAGRAVRPRGSRLLVAVGLLLVTFALSSLVATDLNLAAKEMLKWMELAAVYVAGVSLLETPGQRRLLLYWLVAAAVSEALLGMVQAFGRFGPAHFMIGGLVMRAYGTFEQPNPYGGFLGLGLPLAVGLAFFSGSSGWRRRVQLGAAGVIGLALALTLSRGAWVGQAVALLLVVTISSRTARHAVITFGGLGLILLVALWPLLPPELSGRVVSAVMSFTDLGALRDAAVTPENWAVLERFSQWWAGWSMFTHNPVLGVGIGNYNSAYETYRMEQWPVALGHAHNHYLTVAAEAGVPGLLAYLLFLVTAFTSGVAALRLAQDRLGRVAAAGILGSLGAFAVHNLFDVLLVHGMGVTIGLLLALLQCIPQGMEDAPNDKPARPRARIDLQPPQRAWGRSWEHGRSAAVTRLAVTRLTTEQSNRVIEANTQIGTLRQPLVAAAGALPGDVAPTAETPVRASSAPDPHRVESPVAEASMTAEADERSVSLGRRFFNLKTALSFLLGIAILVTLFRATSIDPRQIMEQMREVDGRLYAVAALSYLLTFPFRGLRWQRLLRNVGTRLPVIPLTEVIFISWFVNSILPGKMGDLYRGYLLRREYGLSLSRTVGTVVAERVVDLLGLIVLLGITGFFVLRRVASPEISEMLHFGWIGFGVVIAGMLLLYRFGERMVRYFPERVQEKYGKFAHGTFASLKGIHLISLLTILSWSAEAARLFFVMQSLHVGLGPAAALFTVAAISLALIVPTPGGLGGVEAAFVLVLGVFGVSVPLALTVALLDRLISYYSLIIFGFPAFLLTKRGIPG